MTDWTFISHFAEKYIKKSCLTFTEITFHLKKKRDSTFHVKK